MPQSLDLSQSYVHDVCNLFPKWKSIVTLRDQDLWSLRLRHNCGHDCWLSLGCQTQKPSYLRPWKFVFTAPFILGQTKISGDFSLTQHSMWDWPLAKTISGQASLKTRNLQIIWSWLMPKGLPLNGFTWKRALCFWVLNPVLWNWNKQWSWPFFIECWLKLERIRKAP